MGSFRMFSIFVAALVICSVPTQVLSLENDGPLSAEDYPYHEQLDENYSLRWKFNSTHILFHARVKTLGYIGLGISANGKMYPSDVLIAWVRESKAYSHDRHATTNAMPQVDKKQDWHVYGGREEGGHTEITVLRKLNTCDDEEDMPITSGTTRVIYAYHTEDPNSENDILYHGSETRGTKSILLLDPPPKDNDVDPMPGDVVHVDMTFENYSVPNSHTTYACKIFKLPKLDGKHHMIRYEPIIQTGHEKLVHHMVLRFCRRSMEAHVGKTIRCYRDPPDWSRDCESTFIAWAIGGSAFDFPVTAGYSMGTDVDPGYFKFEMHYDNVAMRSDLVDNSGLRLSLTKQLRQHDAGMLEVGVIVDRMQIIPPYNDNFLSQSYCPEACIEQAIGDGEIRIFASLLHSHLIGKVLKTRHIRNGVELPPILDDMNYDFNFQESRLLAEERVVKKGDMLMTDCYYDSSKRDTVTYGGLSSREEMCTSFMLYYPRMKLIDCWTRLNYSIDGQAMYSQGVSNYVNEADWSLNTTQQEFAKNVATSEIYDICIFHNEAENYYHPSNQPKTFKAYTPMVDECKSDVNAALLSPIPNHIVITYCACFVTLFQMVVFVGY